MSRPPSLPAVTPSGELLLHMGARRRQELIGEAFERLGGIERLVHEFGKNSEAYREFAVKLWGKGAAKATSVEHTLSSGMESLVDRADEAERFSKARTIDGYAVELAAEDDDA